jgi:hypothetical protein
MVCGQIPYTLEQGIFEHVAGKISRLTGKFSYRAGIFAFGGKADIAGD